MAVVFAKQAGNWTDTTLWAFWNESTQQIEDYGRVPQDGDVVYSNSYVVNINTSPISCSEITNTTNIYTNLSGGYFIGTTGSIVVNANVVAQGDETTQIALIATTSGNSGSITINGDITGCIKLQNRARSLYINGNLNGNIWLVSNSANSSHTITINGNVTTSTYNIIRANVGGGVSSFVTLTINGNIELHDNQITYGISADYRNYNTTINGSIHTTSLNPIFGTIYTGCYLYLNGEFVSENGAFLTNSFSQLRIGSNARMQLPDTNGTMIWFSAYAVSADYPLESNVKNNVTYDFGRKVGTYQPDYPPESVVMQGVEYAFGEMVGTMNVSVQVGCVTPEDVRKDVPLVGMGVVGSLVVPSVDDVREGVVFDNGSVGTLIVQGGGDRLRIADFGYYTNAQSDTYIVDLTEQDKPKFAVAEERVLIEMFPDLDLDNIPDKYFDDLFVKYLKYRLIVEYYRTAGINSTFTPSEPTTEIVNYQNVRNEVWLNSANIYLKAWGKKYPESIVKPQRILL